MIYYVRDRFGRVRVTVAIASRVEPITIKTLSVVGIIVCENNPRTVSREERRPSVRRQVPTRVGWRGVHRRRRGNRRRRARRSAGRPWRAAERDRAAMEPAVSNSTAPPSTSTATVASSSSPSTGVLVGATATYTLGVFGNLLALFILHRTRSSSNQKHGFMLRCLATNDCIALAGMLVQMYVARTWPDTAKNVWSCRFRVLWRFFGLGSGCVASIMAVERWLALTKPFFYQKVRRGPSPSIHRVFLFARPTRAPVGISEPST